MSVPQDQVADTWAIYVLELGKILHRYPGSYGSEEEANAMKARYQGIQLGGGRELWVLPYDDDVPPFAQAG